MTVDDFKHQLPDIDESETLDWVESFDQVLDQEGENRARFLMYKLLKRARFSPSWSRTWSKDSTQSRVSLSSMSGSWCLKSSTVIGAPWTRGDRVAVARTA